MPILINVGSSIITRESDELGWAGKQQLGGLSNDISDIGAAQSEIVFYCFYM